MKSISFTIDDSGLVDVFMEDDGLVLTKKTVSYTTMLDMLKSCTDTTKKQMGVSDLSPIFPGDSIISTIQIKDFPTADTKWYILLREPKPVDFEFFGTTYKNVGVPKTLFAIKVSGGHVMSFRVVAVKDMFVSSKTPIYAYPFSNVSTSGTVCTGDNFKAINQEVDDTNTYNLLSIPEMFFAMPNSEHSYGHNTSGLYYRDLLEKLVDQPFNNDWLQDDSMTYDHFIKSLN